MLKNKKPLSRLSRWVADHIVQDVPQDIALCALDCKKEQCTLGEWATCDRRLRSAAGELMPGKEDERKEGLQSDSSGSEAEPAP
jgi:hypothetical protein